MRKKIDRDRWYHCIGQGWKSLLDETFDKMEALADEYDADELIIEEVKEKYGSLRIYYYLDGSHLKGLYPAMDQVVEDAEAISEFTCERCGTAGELREDLGWIKTLCEECYQDEIQKYENLQEKRYPLWLKQSIHAMRLAWSRVDAGEEYLRLDCDFCTLQSDINNAEVNGIISPTEAWHLREKYLRIQRLGETDE